MKTKIKISVRNLVEFVLQSGDLVLDQFADRSRMTKGIRGHQKIQKSRPEEYQAEVSVSKTIETSQFDLTIQGRIDGVFLYENHIIVDEIKTTKREPDFLGEYILHWAQLKIYTYIYASENKIENIEIQLTYYNIETKAIKEIKRQTNLLELKTFFDEIIQDYLKWAEKIIFWQNQRNESIKKLEFPFENYRTGQRELAKATYRSIRDKKNLFVQAPTGIGKTIATIFPGFKAFGNNLVSKIFYLTARTTGKEICENTMKILTDKGLKCKAITLTAKEKICLLDKPNCNGKDCEFARNYFDKVRIALEDIMENDIINREIIEKYSIKHKVCPFEFSLLISLWTDLIICDYNYAFDPRVKLKRFFGDNVPKDNYVFFTDEAHNLVDRTRSMFSAEINKQNFLNVRKICNNKLPQVQKNINKINSLLLQFRKICDEKGDEIADTALPADLAKYLKDFLLSTEKWLVQNQKTPFQKALLDLYFQVNNFLKIWEDFDENYRVLYLKNGNDLIVKLFCLNPAEQIKTALKPAKSAIFFSATLTPISYFKEIFGCDDSTDELVLSSPFPPENLKVILANKISTRYNDRIHTIGHISEFLTNFCEAKKGNYLFFFPSYKYMNMAVDQFNYSENDIDLIIQESGMSEQERENFIKKFDKDNEKTLVGFTVSGGIFGEGIDLEGDRLSAVAIIGVGLPAISFERNLIRDFFAEKNRGFEYAYQYPGMIRVLQAAGRVIRTHSDRGVVFLIDDRFANYGYRKLLPQNWKIEKITTIQQLQKILLRFWA
ncbi:MAG: PD-(D/E)XK nuclease family protein [Candidatus Cloacimonetes bacterium]|nr:PD-(D/E)XK nuclease family protein [Candidatus Cloacimonadota bacterium]